MRNKNDITYKQELTANEIGRYIKSIIAPAGVFILLLFTIKQFGDFGTKLICPLASLMWIFGAALQIIMPSHRKECIKETVIGVGVYSATLLIMRQLLLMASGVSSQMIMASYDTPVSSVTGNVIPGYVNMALMITSVAVPIGFLGMQIKRVFSFKRLASRKRIFEQERSIRSNGHIE